MKQFSFLAILLVIFPIASLAQKINFPSSSEPEMGTEAAKYIKQTLEGKNTKGIKEITIIDQSKESDHTPCSAFKYSICCNGGKVTITAGGCWALQKATDLIAEKLEKGKLNKSWKEEGTVEGKCLFPKKADINIRILDDNIWNNGPENYLPAWKDINVDCRNSARCPEFTALMKAYAPDIITLQEYDSYMGEMFEKTMGLDGYAKATTTAPEWHFTPILYKQDSIELLASDNVQYMPKVWASWHKDTNSGSKSFTWAVFRHKSTQKIFAVINTHLWWPNNNKVPGSDMARASQTRLIMAQAEVIEAEYKCPIFVTGDMNAIESSPAIQQFISGGYIPCYKAATGISNRDNGHHVCGPAVTYSRKSNRISPDREIGAIDHCLIYAPKKDVEIVNFDCIQAYFTVKLTDHYPNLVDAKFVK